jgi:hypothetical protein
LKVYTFFYFFCFFLVSPLADARDFLVKKDLRLDWIFLSDEQHQMLPFLDNSSENPHAIHLLITPDYGKESFLRLEIPSATSLFIDNKFIKQNDGGTTSLLSLDSLYTRYNHDSLYLTLYNKVGFDVPPAAAIGYKYSFFDTEMNVNPILSRNMDSNEDYLKIIILVVFAFFVVLHTLLPAELTDFYSIGTLLTFRYTDTLLTKFRSLTKTHTIVIIYQAALLASIMIVSLYYYNNPLGERYPIKINPIIGWLAIFIITTVLIFFKYILIAIVSHLFGIGERTNFYFLEYLRMAMIFYSVIFVLISYTIINHFHSLHSLLSTLIVAVIIFNFLRLIVIYFKLRRMIPIKNLHLFSYLCSTELIPIVIGLNFFIK